jgi:hypothetical protein
VDEDSGQATPLLSKGFVDDIMAGSFCDPAIKNDSSAILSSGADALSLSFSRRVIGG